MRMDIATTIGRICTCTQHTSCKTRWARSRSPTLYIHYGVLYSIELHYAGICVLHSSTRGVVFIVAFTSALRYMCTSPPGGHYWLGGHMYRYNVWLYRYIYIHVHCICTCTYCNCMWLCCAYIHACLVCCSCAQVAQ